MADEKPITFRTPSGHMATLVSVYDSPVENTDATEADLEACGFVRASRLAAAEARERAEAEGYLQARVEQLQLQERLAAMVEDATELAMLTAKPFSERDYDGNKAAKIARRILASRPSEQAATFIDDRGPINGERIEPGWRCPIKELETRHHDRHPYDGHALAPMHQVRLGRHLLRQSSPAHVALSAKPGRQHCGEAVTERCPDCKRPLTECFVPGDHHCLRVAVAALKAQAQRDQETIVAARKVIEAADQMRQHLVEKMTVTDDAVVDPYDHARAEFAKVEGDER